MTDSSDSSGGTKRCSHCKQEKSLAEFGRWARGRDGLSIHCRLCKAEFSRRTRQKHSANPYVTNEPKLCPSCRRSKPATEFHRSRSEADGRQRYCKACTDISRQRNYAKNKANPIQSSGTRQCSSCHLEKPLTDFGIDRSRKMGRSYYCLDCIRVHKREGAISRRDRRELELHEEPGERKTCKACGEHKPREEFTPNLYVVGGREHRCRDCMRPAREAFRKEWRAKNPERWSLQNRQNVRRRKARMKNVECENVDLGLILEEHGMVCHICGDPISSEPATKSESLSFDHVIPISRGGPHTAANIRPAHFGCNSRKHTRVLTAPSAP